MSSKSARPVKTKQEAMFDQVKNALSDVLENATKKANNINKETKDAEAKVTEKKKPATQPAARKPTK